MRLSQLQKWILYHCQDKPINWDDTLSGFYDIEEMRLERDRLTKSRGEFYKLESKIKYRRESVALAFSQLYLARLVKRKWEGKWIYIDEQIWEFASFCDGKIKACREALKEDGDNILMKMTLGNYLEKRENVLNYTKIIPSKEWSNAKGQLCIIGGDMWRYVYPSEIMFCQNKIILKKE
ncbi:hypothetical protein ES705_13752 [subsurface metagenome]